MGATKQRSKLTDKQEQFCLEYLIDFNATQAAIRTGYSAKTAYSQGQRLLNNVGIAERIKELKLERQESARKTVDDIERELEKLAFSDITNVVSWNESGISFIKSSDEIHPDHSAAIESIQVEEKAIGKEGDGGLVLKTKVKNHSKLKALELLGKQKGMFVDKIEHSLDSELEGRLTDALKRSIRGKDASDSDT